LKLRREVNLRPLLQFVAALQSPAYALVLNRPLDFLLANDTAMPMVLLPTSPAAERGMRVLDRLTQLRSAVRVATAVTDFVC
jgi:hypothetical protein